MKSLDFIEFLERGLDIEFFAGVPDSLLAPFTEGIMTQYGISDKHIITVNEGNAVALAAGYHLSFGKVPCVYMQNSGQGNMVNPYASLLAPDVYNIPCVFVIGWRGEPGAADEPQHVFQGKITETLMDLLEIESVIIDRDTAISELYGQRVYLREKLKQGKCIAFLIKKSALTSVKTYVHTNQWCLAREDAIREILDISGEDIIVSTTGKISREIFEIRKFKGEPHQYDFLTVGSMGHCSSIALGIALNKANKKVWCIDGDGSLLMHMGSMALIGAKKPCNFVHVLLNNNAHESVGGFPTVAGEIDICSIARGCGYQKTITVYSPDEISEKVKEAKETSCLVLLEIKVALGARTDLGRPDVSTLQNKKDFMNYLKDI